MILKYCALSGFLRASSAYVNSDALVPLSRFSKSC